MKRLFISSVLVVLIVFAVTFIVSLIDAIGYDFPTVVISFLIASVAAIVALIVVVVWAIPVHFLLRRYGFSNIAWYVVAAIIPSFTFIYWLKPFGNDKPMELITQALFCSLAGGLGSVVFWYLVVYRQQIKKRIYDVKPIK